jgi:hypothetical protein
MDDNGISNNGHDQRMLQKEVQPMHQRQLLHQEETPT